MMNFFMKKLFDLVGSLELLYESFFRFFFVGYNQILEVKRDESFV